MKMLGHVQATFSDPPSVNLFTATLAMIIPMETAPADRNTLPSCNDSVLPLFRRLTGFLFGLLRYRVTVFVRVRYFTVGLREAVLRLLFLFFAMVITFAFFVAFFALVTFLALAGFRFLAFPGLGLTPIM